MHFDRITMASHLHIQRIAGQARHGGKGTEGRPPGRIGKGTGAQFIRGTQAFYIESTFGAARD